MRAIVLFAALGAAAFAQCPGTYTYQQTITVNSGQVPATQTNFPMLVLNPSATLRTVANGGHVQNANGYDIIFVNSGGTTLPFELVGQGTASTSYSASTGNAEFWVNVASMADGAAIYMCYGNSSVSTYQGNDSAVWSNAGSYGGVWHLANGTTRSFSDSTSNGRTLTDINGVGATAGKIDGGISNSNAGNTRMEQAGFSIGSTPTLSLWVANTDSGTNRGMIAVGSTGYWYFGNCGGPSPQMYDGSNAYCGGVISDANLHHVVLQSDSNNGGYRIYLDGALQASAASSPLRMPTSGYFRIGSYPNGNNSVNGKIDEVRAFTGAWLSANWILTEYRNQSNPAAFYAVGAETSVSGTPVITVSPSVLPSNHSGNITLALSASGTAWTGSTVFTVSGVAGVSKVSQNVTSGTSATLVVTTGATTGTLTVTETVTGSASGTAAIAAPALSTSPSNGFINNTPTITLTGTNTLWSTETAAGLFTVSGGTGSSIATPTVTSNTAGTAVLTVGSSTGTLTITDTSTGATSTYTAIPVSSSLAISPTAIPANHAGNITLTLTGTATSWTGSTVFTLSGLAGVTKVSQNVDSATSATVVVTTGASTGSLTVTETVTGSTSSYTTVASPSLSIGPGAGNLNSIQTLAISGINTLWSSETPAGLFTVSGGTGASIGTPTITSNTGGTVALTVGTANGTLTITDTSTGATTTFTAGGATGSGTWAFVWGQ